MDSKSQKTTADLEVHSIQVPEQPPPPEAPAPSPRRPSIQRAQAPEQPPPPPPARRPPSIRRAQAAGESGVVKLKLDSDEYQKTSEFVSKQWKPQNWGLDVPVPRLKAIFKLCKAYPEFDELQKSMQDRKQFGKFAGPGNCLKKFHGTRMMCNFDGTPCDDTSCSVCRIIKDNKFVTGKGQQNRPGLYGEGIYFTSYSHTAKGYGLKKGKTVPPRSSTDFVSPDAGNAVFVAQVLLGRVSMVKGEGYDGRAEPKITEPLDTSKFDSTCVEKSTGNDEYVVPRSEQAKLLYLLVFGAE